MNGTKLPPLYTHTSSLFAQVFEPTNQPNQSSVIHETLSVIQTPDLVSHATEPSPERVSHDLPEPCAVIQTEPIPQLNPCSTPRDTNSEPCITERNTHGEIRAKRRAVHPIATRMNARKDWVQGLGTAKFIAQKYGLAYSTVRSWYLQDNWTAARKQWIKNTMIAHAPVLLPPTPATIPPNSPTSSKLSKIESQLEAIDLMLEKAKTPEDWQKLTNSKDKLLQNFYVLAGIAKPAARKASRTAPARVQPIEPVEPGNP